MKLRNNARKVINIGMILSKPKTNIFSKSQLCELVAPIKLRLIFGSSVEYESGDQKPLRIYSSVLSQT